MKYRDQLFDYFGTNDKDSEKAMNLMIDRETIHVNIRMQRGTRKRKKSKEKEKSRS